MDRRYAFSWDLLGDLDQGRPNLGNRVAVQPYRLMQMTLKDVLEQRLGTAGADDVLREAGRLAGRHFFLNVVALER